MKIRPLNRAWIAALVSASTVVAFAGCTSTKPSSKVQPASATTDPPKKEYQWHDMSTGKTNFKPITPPSQD
jgi:hypothetical protein